MSQRSESFIDITPVRLNFTKHHTLQHWKPMAIIMPTLLSLRASRVVTTTCNAPSEDKVNIMKTLSFQWIGQIIYPWISMRTISQKEAINLRLVLPSLADTQYLYYWPFVRGIHWWPVDSPHKGPVMQKTYPCCDRIINRTMNIPVKVSTKKVIK